MPRVILIEPNIRFDLTAARLFGDIVYVSQRQLNPFDVDAVVSKVQSGLSEIGFDPEKDFICLSGYNLTVNLFIAAASKMHDTLKVLLFDARNECYKERRLTTTVQE